MKKHIGYYISVKNKKELAQQSCYFMSNFSTAFISFRRFEKTKPKNTKHTEVILKIEQESHTQGLTDSIKKVLEGK